MSEASERVRTAFERNARAMSLRPAVAQGTAVTRVRLGDGLACEIEEGAWRLVADMGPKSGGTDMGPNPGVYGRAAFGSCLAIGYAMWAAKLGVPIRSLEIEVQADYDSRGYHGVDDVEPGYVEVRYIVIVDSDAPEPEIMHWLDTADAHSDYLAVFRDPQRVRREVRIAAGR